jgi:hypothetical protein
LKAFLDGRLSGFPEETALQGDIDVERRDGE